MGLKPYKFPFRVGRKQRRAVLDAEGREIVVFPKGCEDMAIEFATFKNTMEAERLKVLNERWPMITSLMPEMKRPDFRVARMEPPFGLKKNQ